MCDIPQLLMCVTLWATPSSDTVGKNEIRENRLIYRSCYSLFSPCYQFRGGGGCVMTITTIAVCRYNVTVLFAFCYFCLLWFSRQTTEGFISSCRFYPGLFILPIIVRSSHQPASQSPHTCLPISVSLVRVQMYPRGTMRQVKGGGGGCYFALAKILMFLGARSFY